MYETVALLVFYYCLTGKIELNYKLKLARGPDFHIYDVHKLTRTIIEDLNGHADEVPPAPSVDGGKVAFPEYLSHTELFLGKLPLVWQRNFRFLLHHIIQTFIQHINHRVQQGGSEWAESHPLAGISQNAAVTQAVAAVVMQQGGQ